MSLPEAHALELLHRYYITRIDREVCGDDFQTAYKAATRACLDAMGVLELPTGASDLRAVPARACGCPDDGDGHYGTCLLSREEP